MSQRKIVSLVIPVYNEQDVLHPFYERTKKVLESLPYDYEILFVDDGSSDQSFKVLCDFAKSDRFVRIIQFTKNFGHMKALAAGLDSARGDAVITLDSDLQHPPELIPELLTKWEKGTKIVSTIRESTEAIGFFRKNTARLFYWVFNKITQTKINPNAADFRLFDKTVVEALKNFQERVRFLRGLVDWMGYGQEYVTYQADPRYAGRSKYTFFRMLSFAIDGITSFSAFPLRAATYLGLGIAFFSSIYILYALFIKLTGRAVAGWTSILVVVLFIGGIQLIFLGILGEYLSRIYEETKRRPLYIVNEKVGFLK